ncbi:MAG: (Na+)-NQR maturation NqrM [Pseudomonadales bacterium]
MLVIVGGMSVGVMFGRKPIAGSCGGMKALGMNMECDVCGGDPNACDSAAERPQTRRGNAAAAALGSDATRSNSQTQGRTL